MEKPENYDNCWGLSYYAYNFDNEPDEAHIAISRKQLIAFAWLRSMRDEVYKLHKSLIVDADGRHRSTKSVSMDTIACLFSDNFERWMEKRIVQSAEELLREVEIIDQNKEEGPIIIVDEGGVSMNASDWFQSIMKAITKTFSVIGYLHPIIIIIAPVKDLVLSGIRKMSHIYIHFDRTSNDFSWLTPYNISYSSMRGKYFYKHPIVNILRQKITIKRIKLYMPPKEIVERYQKIEQARKPQLLKEIREEGTKSKIKAQRDVIDTDEIAAFVAQNYHIFQSKRSKPDDIIISEDLVQSKYRCSQKIAKMIKITAEQKLIAKKQEVVKNVGKNADN